MAGLYLHIPFCPSRCSYCDFYSTTRTNRCSDYTEALIRELKSRKSELSEPFHTVYFGGGTPSSLSIGQLERIWAAIHQHLNTDSLQEATFEANSDDLKIDYLKGLKQLGFNRLSIGIQSFNDHFLQQMNRRHTAAEAVEAYDNARRAGFDNISIDLMYGLPQQNISDWTQTLNKAIQLRPEHCSAYHLSYEPGTRMYASRTNAVSEETSLAMFELLCSTLSENGYKHYEISNFALPGYHSRHNSLYWNGTAYLGLGPGAHSYDGKRLRSWNPGNLDAYLNGTLERTYEQLTEQDYTNELIMTRLRTSEGLDIRLLPTAYISKFRQKLQPWLKNSCVEMENDIVRLTKNGIFVSDSSIRDLFE